MHVLNIFGNKDIQDKIIMKAIYPELFIKLDKQEAKELYKEIDREEVFVLPYLSKLYEILGKFIHEE